ncbi:MAG: hypothetical protein ABI378_12920 [Chitinophagaceae bacterium]
MIRDLSEEPYQRFHPGDFVKVIGEPQSMQVVHCQFAASHFYIQGAKEGFCKCKWKDKKGQEYEKWFRADSLKKSY